MSLNISPKFTFQGWNIITFLKGNKEFIKTIIALGFGASGYLVTNGYVETGLALIISKTVLDLVDYYTTEVLN